MDIMVEKVSRVSELMRRVWRVYVNPPKESKVYVSPEILPVVLVQTDVSYTAPQPKQVAVYDSLAIVSCMSGKRLQFFDFNKGLKMVDELFFEDQCVEVDVFDDLILATTTNFSRNPSLAKNRLWLLDARSRTVISSVETGGNWSKVAKLHPNGEDVFVTNWHSHDISIISIKDKHNPKLIQILKPDRGRQRLESPRGIAFVPDGSRCLITGFYSRNILEIVWDSSMNKYVFSHISDNLGNEEYGGAPRDILVMSADRAIYSNLGDNTLNEWSINEHKVTKKIKVGKSPNSVIPMPETNWLAVSCRASEAIYLIDGDRLEIIGRSEKTGKTPTGLTNISGGLLVTDFDSGVIRKYTMIR